MKKTLKKVLALILSVVMLMSLTSVGMVAFAESQPKPMQAELKLGSSVVVPMTESGTAAYLTVVPEKSDVYVFSSGRSNGQSNVYATLLNENGNRLYEAGNVWWDDYNFKFGYYLEAGKTYSLRIDVSWKEAETITVDLSESLIEKIVITGSPVIIENTNGYISNSNDEEFYNYDWEWSNSFSYNVVFKDGYVMEHSGIDGFAYNNNWYEIEIHDNQYEEHWYAGNTYDASISIFGVSATVPVAITEAPITNIVFEPLEIIENTEGYYQDGPEGPESQYFHYNWQYNLKYTVYFNDGSAVKGEGTSFEYNGEYYSLQCDYNQYYNPFILGNTYTVPMSAMGKTFNASVSIVETPVESFVVTPSVTLIENLDGSLQNHDPNNIWFYYNWQNSTDYTLTLKDGTVYTSSEHGLSSIEYQGKYYSFTYGDTQHGTHWNVGETHTVTLSVLGVEKEIEVNITESPVESVTVNPVNIREGKNGYSASGPNGDRIFIYYWTEKLEYTVNFKDGSSASFTGQNFSYNGKEYNIRYDNFEQYQNSFTLGINTVTLTIFGKEVEVTVNVNASPVKNVTVDPLLLTQYTGGHFNYDESGNSWYYYNWHHKNLTYTVEMTDGTIINTSSNYGFNYEGDYYNLSYNTWDLDQYETHLYSGNTYTVPATLDGKSCEIQITIVGEEESDGYTYLVQNGTAIITSYSGTDKVINIPSTLNGNTVVGIMELYDWEDDEWDTNVATTLNIPDTVTMLSSSLFNHLSNLEVLNLGSGISELNNNWLLNSIKLSEINVSKDNQSLTSIDGVVFTKDATKLVAFPVAKQGYFTVPATVTDMDALFENAIEYLSVSLDLSQNPKDMIKSNGVIYNTDKTKVLFSDKDKTGSYVMPDTVTEISMGAFAGSSFEEVTVSNNVTEIVYGAFSNALNLSKVTLPAGIIGIGFDAFRKCESLQTITLPEGLESLSSFAFAESGIKNITIPSTVEYIGDNCFGASALENIVIREGVVSIGYSCFANSNIQSLTLPDSIEYIEPSICVGTPLKELTLSKNKNFTEIPYEAFASTDLVSFVIPENIKVIDYYAFAYSDKLTNVDFQSADLNIREGAFYGCPLEEIELKEGTRYVSDYAFYGNNATSLKLPESVTHVTYYSFANSKNLTDINVSDNLETLCGFAFDNSAWLNNQPFGAVYLENYLYGYKYSPSVSTEVVIKEGTKLIADYAFAGEQHITKLHIPASVTYIGQYALFDCLFLEEITVDEDNEYYYVENDVLYSADGEVIWAKPTSVNYVFGLITEFEYGEPFGTEMEFWASLNTASEDHHTSIEAFWSTWYDLPFEEIYSGYNPYKVGTQTVTIHLGCVDYQYEVTVKERTTPKGDANGDGAINVKDIADVKKWLAGLLSKEEEAALNCDIDENEVVNVADLAHLKKMIAGLI